MSVYRYIFWLQMLFNNSFYIASHRAAINFLIGTSSLLFFFRLLYVSTRFLSVLTLESSAIHWLTNWQTCFRVSGCFLCFFGCCGYWLPWISHVPHASSRITTWGTIFMERSFSVSNEWVRSWSHAFLITYDKTLTKKLSAVRPEKVTRRKKRKKSRICKASCVKRKRNKQLL